MIQKLYGLGVDYDTKQMWRYKEIMSKKFIQKVNEESYEAKKVYF